MTVDRTPPANGPYGPSVVGLLPLAKQRAVVHEQARRLHVGEIDPVGSLKLLADAFDIESLALAKELLARQPSPAEQDVRLHEEWRYKPNRGVGLFRVVAISGNRVTLRSNYHGKDKTISLKTLRGDYERRAA